MSVQGEYEIKGKNNEIIEGEEREVEPEMKVIEIEEKEWEESQIKGYKMAERESEYGGIKQRWVVVESEARKKARVKQIDKHIDKQEEKAQASLRKLYRQLFACKDDAEKAIKTLSCFMEISPNKRN